MDPSITNIAADHLQIFCIFSVNMETQRAICVILVCTVARFAIGANVDFDVSGKLFVFGLRRDRGMAPFGF
jgi:hypothetical protein